ncbi:type VI secretion system-associated FHA domain protein TagH [Loktanella sp. M215]|uniref:type VI secretion system-associated FHA domain protein TagH n=1 Tax=Loktanella sp. M215 TaxID=2675431 RepID=UPI001F00066C|nr:type VI secretion system-associated FHA domain protein TagH [Loktanella sp. M215]MCF7699901.1 type VI secretion system-associated FHA domain protein TagH [Loktanella sp. M215]
MPVTIHFQSTGTMPANARPARMVGGTMTLGRSDQNDLVLPDPDKTISGRHCAIEDHGGNVVVVDFSTNGTFLNYGKIPLGKVPTPLNDGDILSVGRYELLVEIARADTGPGPADLFADIAQTAPDQAPARSAPPTARAADMSDFLDPLGDADGFLDDLLGGPTAGPAGVRRDVLGDDGLLPPLGDDEDFLKPARVPDGPAQSSHASSLSEAMPRRAAVEPAPPVPSGGAIPDNWDLDLLGGTDFSFGEPFEPTQPAPPAAAPVIPDEPILPAATVPPATAPSSAAPNDAARAFLEALGAGDLDIPDAELTETMARLGGVLNTMIGGLRDILMTRQSIKSEFRMQQTVISAGANNPLKFSVSVDQAITAMVRPATKGYLPAAAAASEALNDIKAHEIAMMTGMEAALKGVLGRLDPKRLTERIASDSSLRSVLTNKKARYWDVFETQYAEISDQAENDFHDLFSKEFARAYQAQLDRLKAT